MHLTPFTYYTFDTMQTSPHVTSPTTHIFSWRKKLPMLGFFLLFLVNYWPTFRWMIARWDEEGSYSSHGWLIPWITLYLIYQNGWVMQGGAQDTNVHPRRPALLALGLIIFSLLIHAISGLADVSSLSGLSMIPLLMGFAALFWGWAWVKNHIFALGFLVFMVPPPEFIISGLNFKLKLWASDLAAVLLNLTGLPAIREGSFMLFGEEKLAIGDVCSGLRSLIALLAVGVLFAWLMRSKGKRLTALLLAALIPAAIFGNALRIGIVSYLVYGLGTKVVFKPILFGVDLHLLTGFFIFGGALGLLYSITLLHETFKTK
jgi:exosortase